MSLLGGANSDVAVRPVEHWDSGPTSASFHDLHRDQPEVRAVCGEGAICDSSCLSDISEPSLGTKRAAEDLGITLRKNSRRPTEAASRSQRTDLRRSERHMELRSQQNSVHHNRVLEPSASRKPIQCDRVVSRTSSEASADQNGAVVSNNDCQNVVEKRSNRKERKRVDIKVTKHIISDDEMEKAAKHLGNDWRQLGMKLGFAKGELDAFEYDYHLVGLCEIIYQMLLTWREKLGNEAYVGVIAIKLVEIKRADVAKLFAKQS